MEADKGYKYRLYPTLKQRRFMNRCIGCCRFVYNWALAQKKEAYTNGTSLSIGKDISPKLPELKKENPWLGETDAIALISELNDLYDAYQNFFKNREKGCGFPKFKHKQSAGSYRTQLKEGWIDVENNRIKLPKIGWVKCVFHRDIKGIVKRLPYVTVSRTTTGSFYVSITATYEIPAEPASKATKRNTIGIDLGVKDLAILDNGTVFHKFEDIGGNGEWVKKTERRKKHLQRLLSKKVGSKKGEKKSVNYQKLQYKINKLYARVAARRDDYRNNVVAQIVGMNCTYIGVETLNVRGMSASGKAKKEEKLTLEEYNKLSKDEKKKYNRKKKKGFNRSIRNVGMYSFKQSLVFKARNEGKKVIGVDRFYASSQICSKCGYKNNKVKNLSVREWTCPECGTHHDNRDHNAAINLRQEAIDIVNKNGETTPKNLRRCTPKVRSAEAVIRNEKTVMVGVCSTACEPEKQRKTMPKALKTSASL